MIDIGFGLTALGASGLLAWFAARSEPAALLVRDCVSASEHQ
jgi:hypothetical protein